MGPTRQNIPEHKKAPENRDYRMCERIDASCDAASQLRHPADKCAAESGAVETQNCPEAARGAAGTTGPLDADLGQIIRAWLGLAPDVKAAIIGIVRGAKARAQPVAVSIFDTFDIFAGCGRSLMAPIVQSDSRPFWQS